MKRNRIKMYTEDMKNSAQLTKQTHTCSSLGKRHNEHRANNAQFSWERDRMQSLHRIPSTERD